MTISYALSDVAPYVNWAYFYFAWQVKQPQEQQRLRHEAEAFLKTLENRYWAHALFLLADAHSDGDDIMVEGGGLKVEGATRIPCLRQQEAGSDHLCLADFIAPVTSYPLAAYRSPRVSRMMLTTSKIGLFATSVDHGMETDFDADPYQKMMAQVLADRLAEAAAERLHEQVRKTFWGYAPDEHLTIAEMQQERFQGIRPAVGYPSLPDASINFVLDRCLDMQQIGISLTESGAMRPHASVSGLMIAHPQARYFTVGKIGADQLADYARRRGMNAEAMRRFLISNL